MIQNSVEIHQHILVLSDVFQIHQVVVATPFGPCRSLLVEFPQIPQICISPSPRYTVDPVSVIGGSSTFAGRGNPKRGDSDLFQDRDIASETTKVFSIGSNVPFEGLEYACVRRGRSRGSSF